jgi:hypothetical protein
MNSRNLLCDSATGHNLESFFKIPRKSDQKSDQKPGPQKPGPQKPGPQKDAVKPAVDKAAADMSRMIDAWVADFMRAQQAAQKPSPQKSDQNPSPQKPSPQKSDQKPDQNPPPMHAPMPAQNPHSMHAPMPAQNPHSMRAPMPAQNPHSMRAPMHSPQKSFYSDLPDHMSRGMAPTTIKEFEMLKNQRINPEMIYYNREPYNNPQVEECYENSRDHLNYNTISNTWKAQKKYTL